MVVLECSENAPLDSASSPPPLPGSHSVFGARGKELSGLISGSESGGWTISLSVGVPEEGTVGEETSG